MIKYKKLATGLVKKVAVSKAKANCLGFMYEPKKPNIIKAKENNMVRLRKVLVALLVVILGACSVAFCSETAKAASQTSYFSYDGIKAGTIVLWYPSSNSSGYSMTGGGIQKLKICMSTSGNNISTGLYSVVGGTYNSFYSGTLSSNNTSELSRQITSSGYYKPYLKNNNTSVSITVYNTSYIKYN